MKNKAILGYIEAMMAYFFVTLLNKESKNSLSSEEVEDILYSKTIRVPIFFKDAPQKYYKEVPINYQDFIDNIGIIKEHLGRYAYSVSDNMDREKWSVAKFYYNKSIICDSEGVFINIGPTNTNDDVGDVMELKDTDYKTDYFVSRVEIYKGIKIGLKDD